MQALPPGLEPHPKSGIFQLRIGIPQHLRHLFPRTKSGKLATDAYRASLKTSNRAEAIALAYKLRGEYADKFQALEDAHKPAQYIPLTPELEANITQAVSHRLLAEDDFARRNPRMHASGKYAKRLGIANPAAARSAVWKGLDQRMTVDQLRHVAGINQEHRQALQLEAATGGADYARLQAERVCAVWNVRVDWASPVGAEALQRITRAAVRAWQGITLRDQGEPVDTPPPPVIPEVITKSPEPAESPKTLRDVMPLWERRTGASASAIQHKERALKLFEQAVGALPLDQLTKAVGACFVDFLLDPKRGFIAKTAHNHALNINALVEVAVKADLMERNPFDLSFDKTVGSGSRESWTDDELAKLFSHRLFTADMDSVPLWRNVSPRDARAALLILMHTGARAGEIAQLRKQDFQTRNGIKTIRITDEAGSVKTADSERIVALASHLLADPWFAQWHSSLEGDGVAFPSLHGRARKTPSDTLTEWFGEFRRSAELPAGRLNGTHKFRHWIRTALAGKHVATEVADSITGHSAKGSAGRTIYTGKASPSVMLDALDKIDWPKIAVD